MVEKNGFKTSENINKYIHKDAFLLLTNHTIKIHDAHFHRSNAALSSFIHVTRNCIW